jgi:hypothetical protein
MKIPKRVKKVSKMEKKSLVERGLKLNEEAGELSAEILRWEGLKGTRGKTQKEIMYDLHLEAVDCLLMAMDILVHTGATERRIKAIMDSQLDKWMEGVNT